VWLAAVQLLCEVRRAQHAPAPLIPLLLLLLLPLLSSQAPLVIRETVRKYQLILAHKLVLQKAQA
jgi:hypothetical protein